MPINAKVYGASGVGYYIASHYSVIDPDSAAELYQGEEEWRSRMASITGQSDAEMIKPEKRQAAWYWYSRYAIVCTGIVGILIITLIPETSVYKSKEQRSDKKRGQSGKSETGKPGTAPNAFKVSRNSRHIKTYNHQRRCGADDLQAFPPAALLAGGNACTSSHELKDPAQIGFRNRSLSTTAG